jgi:tripartite-type tricarboxylate transporter receptor subunit TctC
VPNVTLVHPSVPAKTIPEFIAYAKANPGKISMASGGIGTPGHVSGELFKMMTGVNLVHVPYRDAAPALTDLLGGQVQVYFPGMTASLEYIRAGKLRALAVTTMMRSEALPDVPTVDTFVPSYEASQWYGIGAPKNTTLPHFSVSSAISFPKSAGEPGSVMPPRSASRALILGSARAALISLLRRSTISAGDSDANIP